MAGTAKDYAAELQAMGAIMEALANLDRDSQVSVLKWVLQKLDLVLGDVGRESRNTDIREEVNGSAKDAVGQVRPGNINTVATKIGADSCRTVLIAAALHLTLFQNRDSFTRSELVALARTAKVWKSDYTNQTSTMIGRLADAGVLVEKSKDNYFLPDTTLGEYQPMLN